jgi:hypothetical protein
VPPTLHRVSALSQSWADTNEKTNQTGVARRFSAIAALALSFIVCTSSGCRSKAYRDVYAQKMASEIRVLEDQLYEADYQNQILRDELMRAQIKASQVVVPDARPRRSLFGRTLDESGRLQDSRPSDSRDPDSPAQRSPGPGSEEPAPQPRALPSEQSPLLDPPDNAAPTLPAPALPAPALPARPLPNNRLPSEMLVPPQEATPPGAADLLTPDVDLGVPVPPPSPDEAPDALPGQITLPDSARILGAGPPSEPVAIRINRGLSGGHKSDDAPEEEGVLLVIEAIDEKGSVVRLDQFDIDANLSIVLVDPNRSGEEAQLGKWEFTPAEVRGMIRSTPSVNGALAGKTASSNSSAGWSALQVVIPWTDVKPTTTTVMAQVRLGNDEVVMQAQGEVPTNQPSMAQWTPRAAVTR